MLGQPESGSALFVWLWSGEGSPQCWDPSLDEMAQSSEASDVGWQTTFPEFLVQVPPPTHLSFPPSLPSSLSPSLTS